MGRGVVSENFSGMASFSSWMLPLDWRNTALDHFFYDVAALSTEEQRQVLGFPQREGAALLVAPAAAGRPIRYVPRRSFGELEKADFAVVGVAGVGSSALGTAALARQLADALGEPVLGVISGRGVENLISEALGGWFLFRTENMVGEVFDLWRGMSESLPSFRAAGRSAAAGLFDGYYGGNTDSNSLLALLGRFPDKIRLVVGHSKGSLLIANALRGLLLKRPDDAARLAGLGIVTLGAAIGFPAAYGKVFQVIGGADGFGALNSDAPPDHVIAGAAHHLNPAFPCCLPLTAALAALPEGWSPPATKTGGA